MDFTNRIVNSQYRLVTKIAPGDSGDLYLANWLHSKNGSPLAVKILNGNGTFNRMEGIIRFTTLANTITKLKHQNIIKVYDIGEVFEFHYYIAMEHVAGESLAARLAQKTIPLPDAVDIIRQVCLGLDYLHRKGILHGNLKPGNIIITESGNKQNEALQNSSEYKIKLTDFGLTPIQELKAVRSPEEMLRIFGYMAPEHGGIVEKRIDERSDLYSLGILFYQLLTGVLPFSGADIVSILHQHIAQLPELPTFRNPRIPAILEKIVLKLLEKEPEKRYQNARGLLRDLEKFCQGQDNFILEFCGEYDQPVYRTKLLARENELRTLTDAYKNLLSGQGGLCLISGEIGSGKTRLMDEFQKKVTAAGGSITVNPCSAHDIEPGQTVLFDDLHKPDQESLLVLNELISALEARPLLIIGAYRSEEMSAAGLLDRIPALAGSPATKFERIHLNRFSAEQLNRFVAGVLFEAEEDVRAISGFIFNKSHGNLFFAVELLKSLIEKKVIFFKDNRWDIDKTMLPEIEPAARVVTILISRMKLLGEAEQDLLAHAAVMGMTFDPKLLSELEGAGQAAVHQLMDKAAALYLIEPDLKTFGSFRFVHKRIQTVFYERIPAESRRQYHLRIATVIEQNHQQPIDQIVIELADHYLAAGENEKSIEYAFPAGLAAKANYANKEAIHYFSRGVDLLGGSKEPPVDPLKREIWIKCMYGLGDAFLIVGKNDEAITLYDTLLPHTQDRQAQADIYKQLSQAHFKKGDFNACEKYGRVGLELLGEHLPAGRCGAYYTISKELLVRLFHRMLPFLLIRKHENKADEGFKTIMWFYVSLLWSFVLSDVFKYTSSALRCLNLAERRIGPSKELGMVYAGYAMIWASIPLYNQSIDYLKKALKLRDRLDDKWGIAQTYQFLGFALSWQGQYRRSITCFQKSKQLFEKIGDMRELGMSVGGLLHNYILISDYEKAKCLIDHYNRITHLTKDVYGISESWIYRTAYYFETGEIEKAEYFAVKGYTYSLERKVFFPNCIFCIELGRICLEKGDVLNALEYLKKAKELYRTNHFLKHYTVQLYNYLAEALMASYTVHMEKMEPGEKKRCLKKIKIYCDRAVKNTRNANWTAHRGGALLASAKYHALTGNHKDAEGLFQEMIAHCEKIGRRYEQARGLYEYGLFLSQSGSLKNARLSFASAYQIFNEIGSKAFVEKIRAMLGLRQDNFNPAPIRNLVDQERLAAIAAWRDSSDGIADMAELIQRMISKATLVTGAQRGLFFGNNPGQDPAYHLFKSSLDQDPKGYCKQVIADVLQKGAPVLVMDAAKDPRYAHDESVRKEGLKSILCLPIKAQKKTIAVCYFDNSLSSGVFTPKDASMLSSMVYDLVVPLLQQDQTEHQENGKKPSLTEFTREKIKEVIAYITTNYTSPKMCRQYLADSVGINPDHMGKFFKQLTGKKVNDYINELRIKDAADKLIKTDDNIINIAFAVGFDSLTTFNRAFFKIMNVTPSKYRGERCVVECN